VCESAGPVGWRGAPRSSWGQRTPRGLAGGRCLAPSSKSLLSNGSRVLHPRQSEERRGLLQSDVVVFANVIVIVFFADGKRFYCIWLLTSYLTSLVIMWQLSGISEFLG